MTEQTKRPYRRIVMVALDMSKGPVGGVVSKLQSDGLLIHYEFMDHWVSDERLKSEMGRFGTEMALLKNEPD